MPPSLFWGRRVQTTTQSSVTRRWGTRSAKGMSGHRPVSDGRRSIEIPVLGRDLRSRCSLPLGRQGNLRFPLTNTYHGCLVTDLSRMAADRLKYLSSAVTFVLVARFL